MKTIREQLRKDQRIFKETGAKSELILRIERFNYGC